MKLEDLVKQTLVNEISETAVKLPNEHLNALKKAFSEEPDGAGKTVLKNILKNLQISENEKIPMCQDTGMLWFLVRIGEQIKLDFSLNRLLNEVSETVFKTAYLRPSVVEDPLLRKNTLNNSPPVIQYELTEENRFEIWFMSKGFGSENAGASWLLRPTSTPDDIIEVIVNRVLTVGGGACPPVTLGIGLGGTADYAALLSKKALFTPLGKFNSKPHLAEIEQAITEKLNASGLGPGGVGGTAAVLHTSISEAPVHIAGLPCVLSVNCWANRKKILDFTSHAVSS